MSSTRCRLDGRRREAYPPMLASLCMFSAIMITTPYGWSLVYDLEVAFGVTSRDPGLTAVDKKVSETIMAMWTQFARTGDPNVEGLIKWPAYEAATDQYLYITEPLEVKSGFSKVGQ